MELEVFNINILAQIRLNRRQNEPILGLKIINKMKDITITSKIKIKKSANHRRSTLLLFELSITSTLMDTFSVVTVVKVGKIVLDKLMLRYHWPSMRTDVKQYIS